MISHFEPQLLCDGGAQCRFTDVIKDHERSDRADVNDTNLASSFAISAG
jgi:hypothetical protein